MPWQYFSQRDEHYNFPPPSHEEMRHRAKVQLAMPEQVMARYYPPVFNKPAIAWAQLDDQNTITTYGKAAVSRLATALALIGWADKGEAHLVLPAKNGNWHEIPVKNHAIVAEDGRVEWPIDGEGAKPKEQLTEREIALIRVDTRAKLTVVREFKCVDCGCDTMKAAQARRCSRCRRKHNAKKVAKSRAKAKAALSRSTIPSPVS